VVLPDLDAARELIEPRGADVSSDNPDGRDEEAEPSESGAGHRSPDHQATVSIQVEAGIVPLVNAFIAELMKQDRPPYVTTFVRRLNCGGAKRNVDSPKSGERPMTQSQRKIVELCTRPEGATGKELAEGCGWPSIAARATCRKLADRFGYVLEENPKAKGRGISFRMVAAPAAEE
jgi:hypothetical protein